MSGTLIAPRGAGRRPKEEWMQLEAPASTQTWRLLPSSTLVITLGKVLSIKGLAAKREAL